MEFMQQIRRELRTAQKPWAFLRRWGLNQKPPEWMQEDEPLLEIYAQQQVLLARGRAVWAALVQANQHLFHFGRQDHPALCVYAPAHADDGERDEERECEWLARAASRLYQLKNTEPSDPQERELAAMVSDEMDRSIRVLPESFWPGERVHAASFMVLREHLPAASLRIQTFPLLIHPDVQAVMIVPKQFWPLDMQRIWIQNRL